MLVFKKKQVRQTSVRNELGMTDLDLEEDERCIDWIATWRLHPYFSIISMGGKKEKWSKL